MHHKREFLFGMNKVDQTLKNEHKVTTGNKEVIACWLTKELRQEVRKVLEPRYRRELTEDEVFSIAMNLTQFMEDFLKFTYRGKYERTNSQKA